MKSIRGNNFMEEPDTKEGYDDTTDSRRYHVCNRGCNLDTEETCDTDEEAEKTLATFIPYDHLNRCELVAYCDECSP